MSNNDNTRSPFIGSIQRRSLLKLFGTSAIAMRDPRPRLCKHWRSSGRAIRPTAHRLVSREKPR
jgi:hypothetical protein